MRYKVTKQYARGAESFCQEFDDIQQARNYINTTLNEEVAMNIKNVTYRISEFGDEVEKYDAQNIPKSTEKPTAESQSSGGKGSGASFRPTPLSTTPRPTGGPQGWLKDEDEEEKK